MSGPQRVFPSVRPPSIDFQAVRDRRRATPLYVELDLTASRSRAAGSHADLNIAGNSFYCDPIIDSAGTSIGGLATAFFEDSQLAAGIATPFTLASQFIARVPFTRVIIENPAQPGKRLRIIYGVDIDFQPGINAQVAISGIVSTREYGLAYSATFKSNAAMLANTSEQVFSVASNVNGAIVWRANGKHGNATPSIFGNLALIAHTAAPNSSVVGDVLSSATQVFRDGTQGAEVVNVERPIFVAAGKGVWWNAAIAENSGYRTALYTLL